MTLHDKLNGFRAGRAARTATLEAKLAQQLALIAHKLLFQVFRDVWKAYDSLDRGQVHGYSVGVRYGTEHGVPNSPSLVQPHFFSPRKKGS